VILVHELFDDGTGKPELGPLLRIVELEKIVEFIDGLGYPELGPGGSELEIVVEFTGGLRKLEVGGKTAVELGDGLGNPELGNGGIGDAVVFGTVKLKLGIETPEDGPGFSESESVVCKPVRGFSLGVLAQVSFDVGVGKPELPDPPVPVAV
jgi:hypothetical protein